MKSFESLIILLPGILAALTIHEFAHGWVAWRLGDPTAKEAGRLTLNPLSHLDPIGTLMLFIVHFGWAKPVPVNPFNFSNPRRDMMMVSIAGPAANVGLALIIALVMRLLINFGIMNPYGSILFLMMSVGVFINLILAFFNMIPIPPLDGSKVVSGLLPLRHLDAWARFENVGGYVLLGLIAVSWMTNISVFAPIFLITRSFYNIFTAGLPSPL